MPDCTITAELSLAQTSSDRTRVGTARFVRTNIAIFASGFGTFSMLWGVQSVLPTLARHFDVTPVGSSLILSLPTLALAACLLPIGRLSTRIGRKPVMAGSLAVSAILTLACAFATSFPQMLVLRLLTGAALAGIPAITNVYLAEEVEPRSVGYAIGLSVAGNALGGMLGRFGAAAMVDYVGLQAALIVVGAMSAACAVVFWRLLPPSRHAAPPSDAASSIGSDMRVLLADKGVRRLVLLAFLLMGGFASTYNYAGFRLASAPFSLSQTAVGAVFSTYLAGIVASIAGGRLADRFGRGRVLWLVLAICVVGDLMMLSLSLSVFALGLVLATMAYFAGHTIAASWVVGRVPAVRTSAMALYMLILYLGASVAGTLAGWALQAGGWGGLVELLVGMHLIAVALSVSLGRLPAR